jgi:hypothetical protein
MTGLLQGKEIPRKSQRTATFILSQGQIQEGGKWYTLKYFLTFISQNKDTDFL